MARNSAGRVIFKIKLAAILQTVFGWLVTLFCGMIALVGSASIEESIDVVMVVFFSVLTALGIWLIIKGSKNFKLIKRFRHYSVRLSADEERSLLTLAISTGCAVEAVERRVARMISVGFFPNCYVDMQQHKLVKAVHNEFHASQNATFVTVQCKKCGATNKIVAGSVSNCEFCSSPISGGEGQ